MSLRRPLDLFVVSGPHGEASARLQLLGAMVNAVSYDRALSLMKLGLRVADAVVIEDVHNILAGDGPIRVANLARTIYALPDWVCMPTGARWNSIPIILIVDDPNVAHAMEADLGFITCASGSVTYWRYIDPWPAIYQRIGDAAYRNALQRLEEMQTIGYRFQMRDGRWLRLVPPMRKRRSGFGTELETALYNGNADLLLKRRRAPDDDWNARDVVLLEPGANERDLYLYEHLVRHGSGEKEMQRFYSQRTFVLGCGAYEVRTHPALRPAGTNTIYPDLVQRSFNDALVPKPARVIELKRLDAKIIVKNGLDHQFSHDVDKGIMQTHRYGDFLSEEKYIPQVEATFGESPNRIEKLLIVGRASKHDRDRLDYVRRWQPYVEVRGYDEMYEEAVSRFAS